MPIQNAQYYSPKRVHRKEKEPCSMHERIYCTCYSPISQVNYGLLLELVIGSGPIHMVL